MSAGSVARSTHSVAGAFRRAGHAFAAVVVLVAARAHAHGPAPAVLEVLQVDGQGRPTLLRTSVGLAEARGDGTYGYLCPSHWSGNELARTFATDDGRVLVLDAGLLWQSDPTRTRFERDEALDEAFAVRDVATEGERVFVLARERLSSGLGRSAVFALGDPPTFLDEHPSDLAVVDGALVASSPTPSLCLTDGCVPLAHDAVDLLTIRAVEPGALHLLATTEARCLWRVEHDGGGFGAVERGPCGERVLGPVRLGSDERIVAIVDEAAHAHRGGDAGWEALEGVHPWTSLDEVDGFVLASTLEGVFRLDGSLEASTLVFRFVQLGGPRAEHEELCTLDWAHFGGESGWVGTAPAATPEGERQTEAPRTSGCAIASTPSPIGARCADEAPVATLMVLLVLARRRFVRPPRPSRAGGHER